MNEQYKTKPESNELAVELYMCASIHGAYEKQTEVIRRIESLVESGVVDAFDRYNWARRISPSANGPWAEVAQEKYDEFRNWARSNDRRIEPTFAQRTVRNEFVDEEYEIIQFPVITVAVYEDGDLDILAPSLDEDGNAYTVDDCLADLAGYGPGGTAKTQFDPEP